MLVDGLPATTPVRQVMGTEPPTVVLGDSAAEALMLMLDRDAEFLLVTDREGQLRGVVGPRDFAISPSTAGVSLHEQLRRARTADELGAGAVRVPAMLGDLLSWGLASGKVIAVYSTFLDTIMRRAIGLVFAQHPELSVDAFTWLSLGSNGRREAVLELGRRLGGGVRRLRRPGGDRHLPGRLRRGVRGAGAAPVSARTPRRHRAAPRVLPDQRRVARGGARSGWRRPASTTAR